MGSQNIQIQEKPGGKVVKRQNVEPISITIYNIAEVYLQ